MTQSPPTGELVARLLAHGAESWAALMDEAAEAITTLERELARKNQTFCAMLSTGVCDLPERLTASQAEVERLKAALKPFAEYMGDMDKDNLGNPLPDDAGVGWVYLTQADFRRARAALQVEESKG